MCFLVGDDVIGLPLEQALLRGIHVVMDTVKCWSLCVHRVPGGEWPWKQTIGILFNCIVKTLCFYILCCSIEFYMQ